MTKYVELTTALKELRMHADNENKKILEIISFLDGYVQELQAQTRDIQLIKADISRSLENLKALNSFWSAVLFNAIIAALFVGLILMLVNYSLTGNILLFWNKKEHVLVEKVQNIFNQLPDIIEPLKVGDSYLSPMERVERLDREMQSRTIQQAREIEELKKQVQNSRLRSSSAPTPFFTHPIVPFNSDPSTGNESNSSVLASGVPLPDGHGSAFSK